MGISVEAILIALMLTDFLLLGSSRLSACIRAVAIQGILLGSLTLLTPGSHASPESVLLAVTSLLVKGIALPWLLFRALRESKANREIEPFIGYSLSLLMGVLGLAVSMWLGRRLELPTQLGSGSLLLPIVLFTSLTGLFLIASRRKAITQVVGYLVMENGIYAFGAGTVQGTPMLVELGTLLDVFVAVFVMGIAIFHISREFDHIDTDQLASLRDWA